MWRFLNPSKSARPACVTRVPLMSSREQARQLLELREPLVGETRLVQDQLPQIREVPEIGEPLVGHRQLLQAQNSQLFEPAQVYEAGVGYARSAESRESRAAVRSSSCASPASVISLCAKRERPKVLHLREQSAAGICYLGPVAEP